jgi:hypothetical protein
MVMDVTRCRFVPFYAAVTDYICLFFPKNKATGCWQQNEMSTVRANDLSVLPEGVLVAL